MVQVKPADADRFVARPDLGKPVILLHGSDDGLIAERAAALTTTLLDGGDASLNRVQLTSEDIASDPARLSDEARAISMFGGNRVIVVRVEGARDIRKPVKAILDEPPGDAWVILQAGELRKGTGLRGLCEKHKSAAAIACYADEARDVARIIEEETKAANLTIDDEARAALQAMLGADRRITRSEVTKLCLYAMDKGSIDLEDVKSLIGDGAAFAIDEAVDQLALGKTDELDRTYRRIVASGTPGSIVAGAAQRHFAFLHRGRAACDRGDSADRVVSSARPPVFFRRQPLVKRQLTVWSTARLERCLEILRDAVLESRRSPAMADEVIAQAFTRIALAAGAPRR